MGGEPLVFDMLLQLLNPGDSPEIADLLDILAQHLSPLMQGPHLMLGQSLRWWLSRMQPAELAQCLGEGSAGVPPQQLVTAAHKQSSDPSSLAKQVTSLYVASGQSKKARDLMALLSKPSVDLVQHMLALHQWASDSSGAREVHRRLWQQLCDSVSVRCCSTCWLTPRSS